MGNVSAERQSADFDEDGNVYVGHPFDDCDVSVLPKPVQDHPAACHVVNDSCIQPGCADFRAQVPALFEVPVLSEKEVDSVDVPSDSPRDLVVYPERSFVDVETHAHTLLDKLAEYERLRHSRDQALRVRDQLLYEWENCKGQHRHLEESQAEFMEVVTEAVASGGLQESLPALQSLYKRMKEDHQEMTVQARKAGKLERKLVRIEHTMQTRERDLANVTNRLVESLRRHDLGLAGNANSLPPNASCDTLSSGSTGTRSTQLPSNKDLSALEKYYDKCGDVKVMQYRLFELEGEHVEERDRRMFLMDQEQPLDLSDIEFEQSFRLAREQAEHELNTAMSAKHEAYLVCIAEGINIETEKPALDGSEAISEPTSERCSSFVATDDVGRYPKTIVPQQSGELPVRRELSTCNEGHQTDDLELNQMIRSWIAGTAGDEKKNGEQTGPENDSPGICGSYETSDPKLPEAPTIRSPGKDMVVLRTPWEIEEAIMRPRALSAMANESHRRPYVHLRCCSESKLWG